MGFSTLATALTVIFFVSVVALIAELLYVLWRHRSFRRHSSPPPPIRIGDQTPDFPTADAATKELLYFFCLKPHLPVDPSEPPNKNKVADASSPNDEVVDVFKLLEANGPSRFLCTIKEEDKEDVDITSDVDFANRSTTTDYACWQSGAKLAREPAAVEEEEEEVAMAVDGDDVAMKTEFSTPCDSPLFFTPAGSPSRDFMNSDFVVSIHVTGNMDE